MGTNVVLLVGKLIEILEHELVIQITGEEDLVPISVGQTLWTLSKPTIKLVISWESKVK